MQTSGGCSPIDTEKQKNTLLAMMRGEPVVMQEVQKIQWVARSNSTPICYRCNRAGHISTRCYVKSDTRGIEIWDEDTNSLYH